MLSTDLLQVDCQQAFNKQDGMEMTSCNKPDFNRLGAKLQQAGKIDNFQKSQ